MIKIDEKHLEDILYREMKSPGGFLRLRERGLNIGDPKHFNVFRQVNFQEYGIPDLLKIEYLKGGISVTIIELKVTDFQIDHLYQLGRYMTAANNVIHRQDKFRHWKVDVNGIIICSGFNPNGPHWLADMLYSVRILTTEYDLDGLYFKSVFSGRWQKNNSDHSIEKFINLPECKQEYMKSYREYLSEKYPTQLKA